MCGTQDNLLRSRKHRISFGTELPKQLTFEFIITVGCQELLSTNGNADPDLLGLHDPLIPDHKVEHTRPHL